MNSLGFNLIIALLISGCAYIRSPLVSASVPLPARPALVECPVKPLMEGKIGQSDGHGDVVILKKEIAILLQTYIREIELCLAINLVILDGHIEKLENRLKAVQP